MMGSTRGSCSKIAELFRLVKWFNLPRAMLRLYMDIVNIFLYILDILLTLSKDRR
jgi:FtsH-binding integral membrane protein